jgi:hypothetical protein
VTYIASKIGIYRGVYIASVLGMDRCVCDGSVIRMVIGV